MAVSSIKFKIEVDTSAIKAEIKKATGSFKAAADDMSDSMETVDKSVKGSAGGIKGFTSSIGKMAGAGLIIGAVSKAWDAVTDSVSDAMTASDAMNKFSSTMEFAGIQGKELSKAKAAVKDYANATVYDLQTVANTSATLAANGVGNYTEMTEALGNLNAIAGGNAETFQSVAQSFTQTVGAGKLTTENWNQLSEAIPGVSSRLQDAMRNAGAFKGNFRDAMSAGEISADEFGAAVQQLGMTDVAKEAATSTNTFEGAVGSLQANMVDGINSIIDAIGKDNITGAINTVSDGVSKAFKVIADNIPAVIDVLQQLSPIIAGVAAGFAAFAVISGVVTLFTALAGAFAFIISPIGIVVTAVGLLVAAGVALYQNWDTVKAWLSSIWNSISETASSVFTAIGAFLSNIWNSIKSAIMNAGNAIWTGITGIWNSIKSTTSSLWNGIKAVISTVWNGIKSAVSSAINAVKSVVSSIWNSIKSVTSSIWNGIKSVITSVWNGIKSGVSNAVNAVKSKISNVWNGIKSTTSNVWNGIKSTISNAINGAKNIVSNVINKIKGLFNFKLKFPSIDVPHIPLPHFSISGSFNPLKGKIPSVGIDWYKTGGIFTGPSVIGVGEAGDEAVLPLSDKSRMRPFASAVAGMLNSEDKGTADSGNGKPLQVHTHVWLNEREIAKAITPKITEIQAKERSNAQRRQGFRTDSYQLT